MDTLPREVVSHIISYLDLRCQLWLSTVSVWWREAVSDCLRRRLYLKLDYPTDDELRALLPRLPALRTLLVYGENELDIDIVSENCPLLEKLDLSQFPLDTDSLERLCGRCPRLREVRLPYGCESTLLELLLRRLPGVRDLSLLGLEVSAAAVSLLPASLVRLELISCGLPLCERPPADRWPRLTELVGYEPADGLAALLAGCPDLRELDLRGGPGAGQLDLDTVSENCPLLQKVNLFPFRLDADSVERLCQRCPRLRDVRLSQSCSSALLELLLRWLPDVRVLDLEDTEISVAAVALLPAGLERLNLVSCTLQAIPRQPANRWPRLTYLALPDPSLSSVALVAGCPRLADVSCSYDDDLVDTLPALHLRRLNLSGAMLADDRVASRFGRLRQLRTLELDGVFGVTDRVLEGLAVMESLTELTLGADEGRLEFTVKGLHRLIVSCRSLSSVRFNYVDEVEDIEWLIVRLDSDLGQDRDVTLAMSQFLLKKLTKWVKPSQPTSLRLVMLHFLT